MFEEVIVIPLYITVLKISDARKNLTREQQIYLGTDYSKAHEAAFGAMREDWPEGVTDLKAFIRYYHIKTDGTIVYILETGI